MMSRCHLKIKNMKNKKKLQQKEIIRLSLEKKLEQIILKKYGTEI